MNERPTGFVCTETVIRGEISLSIIVTVVVVGLPKLKLDDLLLNAKLTVSLPSNTPSSMIGTLKVLLVSFPKKNRVPLVET